MQVDEVMTAIKNNQSTIKINEYISLKSSISYGFDEHLNKTKTHQKLEIVFNTGHSKYYYKVIPEYMHKDIKMLTMFIVRFAEDCFEKINVLCTNNIMKGVFNK